VTKDLLKILFNIAICLPILKGAGHSTHTFQHDKLITTTRSCKSNVTILNRNKDVKADLHSSQLQSEKQ